MESDRDWEERNARRAHENYRLFREIQQRELVQSREAMPLERRARRIASELLLIQHEAAATGNASAPSAEDDVPSIDLGFAHLKPSECVLLLANLNDPDPDVVLEACRALESALDSHRGFLRYSPSDDTDDKDERIVHDFEGWTPSEVMRADSSLGPAAAIRRARILRDRDPHLGHPEDPL